MFPTHWSIGVLDASPSRRPRARGERIAPHTERLIVFAMKRSASVTQKGLRKPSVTAERGYMFCCVLLRFSLTTQVGRHAPRLVPGTLSHLNLTGTHVVIPTHPCWRTLRQRTTGFHFTLCVCVSFAWPSALRSAGFAVARVEWNFYAPLWFLCCTAALPVLACIGNDSVGSRC